MSDKLINAAIDEYEYNKEIHGDDYKMEVDVVNLKLKEILENKYNFKVIQKTGPNKFLMTIDH